MLFDYSDHDCTVYEKDGWKIIRHCWRGYEPWWTLHKRRSFLGFSWWSSSIKFGDYEPILGFIERWENFDDSCETHG